MSGDPHSFNPNSFDAQLATIIERLNHQDRTGKQRHKENSEKLDEIFTQTKATNGRVTKLEGQRKYFLGWIAGASVCGGVAWQFVTAWLR